MLPIVLFPRRFRTANKRTLSTLNSFLKNTRNSSSNLIRFSKPSSVGLSNWKESTEWKRSIHHSLNDQQSLVQEQELSIEDPGLYGERSISWYTTDRLPNEKSFPGYCSDGTLTSLPIPNLETCTRQEVLDYLDNTWALTDILFSSLQGKEAFLTPVYHNLRHPLVFYYGHPTVFYINKFRLAGLVKDPLNLNFEQKFEVGVDEMRWDDNLQMKEPGYWPSIDELTEYRRDVYKIVKHIVQTHPELEDGHAPINQDSQLWALFMGFEHEHIHLETSSVLMQEHEEKFFKKPSFWPDYHPTAYRKTEKQPVEGQDYPSITWKHVESETITIGKPHDFPTFGWDNEYGNKRINVPSFNATQQMITNGMYWEFVSQGGYYERSYWSDEGWNWRVFRNALWPTFWKPKGPSGLHQYNLRVLFDTIDMQWDWPVSVNHHEAQAYAKWKSKQDHNNINQYQIGTEAMHHLLRMNLNQETFIEKEHILHVNGRMSEVKDEDYPKNLNLAYSSPSPVMSFPPTDRGFYDVFGNTWEWCMDTFQPLNGFQIHPFYVDFSTPCFDDEHHIIMGGSFISTGDNGASIFSRYHFRPHFFQHAGFRLISVDSPDIDSTSFLTNTVESQRESTIPVLSTNKLEICHQINSKNLPFGGIFNPLIGNIQISQFIQNVHRIHGHSMDGCTLLKIGGNVEGLSDDLCSIFKTVYNVEHNPSLTDLCIKDTVSDESNVSFKPDENQWKNETYSVIYVSEHGHHMMDTVKSLVSPGGILIIASETSNEPSLNDSKFEMVEEINVPTLERITDRKGHVQILHLTGWRRKFEETN